MTCHDILLRFFSQIRTRVTAETNKILIFLKLNYFQGHVKYISSKEYFSPILDYIYDKDILISASINYCNKSSIKFVNKHLCTCIIRVYYCT